MDQSKEIKKWIAKWINCPKGTPQGYGVYHFRKNFDLANISSSYIIHITADNRYRMFVNDVPISVGSAAGDLNHWFYDTINLAPFLHIGKNTIAVQVWNMGDFSPISQLSLETAIIVQEADDNRTTLNTDSSWKAFQNKAYTPCSLDNVEKLKVYMVVGPGDEVDGSIYPWGWEKSNYDDSSWDTAGELASHSNEGKYRWNLVPRNIPLFNEYKLRFHEVRRTSGTITEINLADGRKSIVIPSHKTVNILLDRSVNTVAYPELIVSGGKKASIKIIYAESLFDQQGLKKNRNDVEGKEIKGNYDLYIADGGRNRKFRPLWFRTYRYVQLDISTEDESLIINDIYGMSSGYPLEMKASFSCSDPKLHEIWTVGWRTAKLCAGDLYYDTPYYEQAQYVGDSRIQAIISIYNSGDDSLMRKAIEDFHYSSLAEGLTQSRYPGWRIQVIPSYSLFWISMIHDYWMYREDHGFIKQFLPMINAILGWFYLRLDVKTQMLGPLPYWNFVDWDNFDPMGTAPGATTGNSSIISLQYAYTLHQAAELFYAFEIEELANEYNKLAELVNSGTYASCYNLEKKLIADTPKQMSFSQHANIWGILSGAIRPSESGAIINIVLKDQDIAQVSLFYRFYLSQAIKEGEQSHLYYSLLYPWRQMLELGLTTFAEKEEPTRSDCHAWSASPNYDFLATIIGIMPNTPGFRRVLIKPALGELSWAAGTMPHQKGKIMVNLKREGDAGIIAEISLPRELSGQFLWNGKCVELHEGRQRIIL